MFSSSGIFLTAIQPFKLLQISVFSKATFLWKIMIWSSTYPFAIQALQFPQNQPSELLASWRAIHHQNLVIYFSPIFAFFPFLFFLHLSILFLAGAIFTGWLYVSLVTAHSTFVCPRTHVPSIRVCTLSILCTWIDRYRYI